MELFVDSSPAATLVRIVAVATKANVAFVEADSDKFKAAKPAQVLLRRLGFVGTLTSFRLTRCSQIPTLVDSGKTVSGHVAVSKHLITSQKQNDLLGADEKEQKEVQ